MDLVLRDAGLSHRTLHPSEDGEGIAILSDQLHSYVCVSNTHVILHVSEPPNGFGSVAHNQLIRISWIWTGLRMT